MSMKDRAQLPLFLLDRPSPVLTDYDWIVLSSSAGKDSQAMIDVVFRDATQDGVADRLVIVHCDLGRVEWSGTRELAEAQAAHYGIRFIVTTRTQNDLLDHVEARGMWPSPRQRYCTSDHKRAPIHRVLTALTDEVRNAETRAEEKGPVRILSCMGLRGEESPARAKRMPFAPDVPASNGRRHVDTWLPLHDWTEEEVWECIKQSGVPSHYAYRLGMPRLSCCFCIFAPKAALVLAGRHNPDLLHEYVRVEAKIGHTFRVDLTLLEVQREVQAVVQSKEVMPPVAGWRM